MTPPGPGCLEGDRSDPGELDRQRPVLFLLRGGEVDFDFGRAAGVGEGRIPALEVAGRDGAVRDWRAWAKTVARLRPATINNTLAAIDDFYIRRGLGPATARREMLPRRAPKALSNREVVRYLRAVEHCASARDTVVALLPF